MRIGLDLDNTIAGFDDVFSSAARAAGLVPAGFAGGKAEVRELLRSGDDGETHWQRLQGRVYGALMSEAVVIDGVAEFIRQARLARCELFVVSHRTLHGHFDRDRVNLHDAAHAWLAAKGICSDHHGIPEENVYIEVSRAAKIRRIKALGLDVFIDDLPEVFAEADFPADVRPILFTQGRETSAATKTIACPDWRRIADAVLGSNE